MANNYCIMRFEKVKTWNQLQAIARHNNRTIPTENSDINPQLSHLNKRGGDVFSPNAIRSHYNAVVKKLTRKPRPDAVKAIHCVATFSNEAVSRLNKEEQQSYFDDCLKAFDEKFGKANRIGYWIHYDEATPHLHCAYIPVDPRGVLNCKHYLGGDISEFQTEFHKAAGLKYGLDRGMKRAEARKHQTLKAYRETLLRKDLEIGDIEEARAGLLALANVNDIENERIALEKQELDKRQEKLKLAEAEIVNKTKGLEGLQKFLEDKYLRQIKALQAIDKKRIDLINEKIRQIDGVLRELEEFKSLIILNGIQTVENDVPPQDLHYSVEQAINEKAEDSETALKGPELGR